MTTWTELARRAQDATGPDRELDTAVMMTAKPGSRRPEWMDAGFYWDGCPMKAPRLTASVDAVLALIAEKLPEWTWIIDGRDYNGKGYRVRMLRPKQISTAERSTHAATPALAILAAFCLAMAATTENAS